MMVIFDAGTSFKSRMYLPDKSDATTIPTLDNIFVAPLRQPLAGNSVDFVLMGPTIQLLGTNTVNDMVSPMNLLHHIPLHKMDWLSV